LRPTRPYRSPRQARYLYFATSEAAPGLVKIGITSQPAVRLYELKCTAIRVFDCGPGVAWDLEKRLHHHYRELRVHGEWFYASHTLLREARGDGEILEAA
jgi:hypothetical protein